MAVTVLSPASLHLSGGSSGVVRVSPQISSMRIDLQDFGHYRIPGPHWVKEKALPSNLPLRRRVQLFNQRDRRLVAEVWSDATTGEYSFDNIRGGDGTVYFVVAFDHTNTYRAAIADNLIPEPMP